MTQVLCIPSVSNMMIEVESMAIVLSGATTATIGYAKGHYDGDGPCIAP